MAGGGDASVPLVLPSMRRCLLGSAMQKRARHRRTITWHLGRAQTERYRRHPHLPDFLHTHWAALDQTTPHQNRPSQAPWQSCLRLRPTWTCLLKRVLANGMSVCVWGWLLD